MSIDASSAYEMQTTLASRRYGEDTTMKPRRIIAADRGRQPSVPSAGGVPGARQRPEPERGTDLPAQIGIDVVRRDPRGIRDPYHPLKVGRYRGGVHQDGGAGCGHQLQARLGQGRGIATDQRLSKTDQLTAVTDLQASTARRPIQRGQIDLFVHGLRAHTEHRGMCVSSVEALVDGGNPGRDEFDLGTVEGSGPDCPEVTHLLQG